MKKLIIFFGLFLIIKAALAQKNIIITLQNPADLARQEEPIVLSRKTLEKYAGNILMNMVPLFKKASGEILASQADDLDGDGTWDEVIFITSFQKKEKYKIIIKFIKSDDLPAFKKRTNARLAKLEGEKFLPITKETMPEGHKQTDFSTTKMPLYQTEGPTWENDKVGFRLYFDPRNGKDIFGKTTSDLVLDRVGLPGDNYHAKNEWGMDILKVGTSLGAGALAIEVKTTAGKTTLARLGENVEQIAYELIADGPVRSILQLHYKNWQPTPTEKYDITETISIIAGQFYYESKVIISNFLGERQLVTGIVNLQSQKAIQNADGNYFYLATHDTQSENKDKLGMGIVGSRANFAGFGETPEEGKEKVLQTYFVKLKAKANQSVSFKFYAGWEATDARFAEAVYFENFLKEEVKRFSKPIKIQFK